ncbi:MAG: TRAP transporter substrate-binding protein DctP [Dehalococcoidales bacterium]|nr:TRAP transporter substrate-binding protein DctP [Dehalococcoidales bacterium]
MNSKRLLTLLGSICLIIVVISSLVLSACAKQTAPTTPAATTPGATTPSATKPSATTPAATTPAATKPATTPAAQVIKWKLQQICPPNGLFWNKTYVPFVKDIEAATNGRLSITLNPPGALCPDLDIFKAVNTGMIEIGISSPGYQKGFLPEMDAVSLPFGWRHLEDMVMTYLSYGLKEHFEAGYAANGVHLLGFQMRGGSPVISRVPVNRAADWKGKKVRTHTTLAMFLEGLGASTVMIPGAEVYTALASGTVDGATWGAEVTIRDFAWHEVAKYMIYPAIFAACFGYDAYVNPKNWAALSPDMQKIVQMSADTMCLARSYDAEVFASIAAMEEMKKKGLQVCTIPESDYPALLKSAENVWNNIAAKGPGAKKAVQIVTNYLRDAGYTSYKIE